MVEGMNSSMIYCKNFVSAIMYPTQHNNNKEKRNRLTVLKAGLGE
jgi:hypothetical protein